MPQSLRPSQVKEVLIHFPLVLHLKSVQGKQFLSSSALRQSALSSQMCFCVRHTPIPSRQIMPSHDCLGTNAGNLLVSLQNKIIYRKIEENYIDYKSTTLTHSFSNPFEVVSDTSVSTGLVSSSTTDSKTHDACYQPSSAISRIPTYKNSIFEQIK